MEMKLDLTKGMTLDLTKDGSKKFTLGLSWDPADIGTNIDVDASAFLLVKDTAGNYKLTNIRDVVYHCRDKSFEKHPSGAVELSEDNTDGVNAIGKKYDETISIDTTRIPENISQINLYINIFKPAVTFRQVKNATVTILDDSDKTLATFNASADLIDENCLLAGTVSRNGSNWDFTARGEGYIIADLNTIVTELNSKGSN